MIIADINCQFFSRFFVDVSLAFSASPPSKFEPATCDSSTSMASTFSSSWKCSVSCEKGINAKKLFQNLIENFGRNDLY
jgi:hypothetical protein